MEFLLKEIHFSSLIQAIIIFMIFFKLSLVFIQQTIIANKKT